MKYLFLILNSILFNPCYAQEKTSGIEAKIFFISAQYNGDGSMNNVANEKGIIIQLFNSSTEDYYIEDGIYLGEDLVLLQNNIYQKLSDLDAGDDLKEKSIFDFVMSGGSVINNRFNKPDDLFEYTKNLITSKLKNTNSRSYAMRTSMGIIYLKSKLSYSIFTNLTYLNLKGRYNVSLKHGNIAKSPSADNTNVVLPDKIKEYKKFTGTITSDVLEIFISPDRPRKL